jgi:hypothetical protein
MMESSTTIPANSDSRNSLGSKYYLSKRNTVSRLSTNDLSNDTFRSLNAAMDHINKQIKSLGPLMGE